MPAILECGGRASGTAARGDAALDPRGAGVGGIVAERQQ
jgi:hypothetical protein